MPRSIDRLQAAARREQRSRKDTALRNMRRASHEVLDKLIDDVGLTDDLRAGIMTTVLREALLRLASTFEGIRQIPDRALQGTVKVKVLADGTVITETVVPNELLHANEDKNAG